MSGFSVLWCIYVSNVACLSLFSAEANIRLECNLSYIINGYNFSMSMLHINS